MSVFKQQDIFDESIVCWTNLDEAYRQEIEEFLTQLFIQALTTRSVIQCKEINHAPENSKASSGTTSVALSSAVNSETTA